MMAAFDPTNRELCPDDLCVGVIGPDGKCGECGRVSPSATQHSRYRGMKADGDDGDEVVVPVEIRERQLCPDEMCVGVIGDDGRCGECGMAVDGGDGDGDDADDDDRDVGNGNDGDEDLGSRELCPDGMCVGVIGSDGRCKECGKSAG